MLLFLLELMLIVPQSLFKSLVAVVVPFPVYVLWILTNFMIELILILPSYLPIIGPFFRLISILIP